MHCVELTVLSNIKLMYIVNITWRRGENVNYNAVVVSAACCRNCIRLDRVLSR